MPSWYSGVDPSNNTQTNRDALFTRINTDPNLLQYNITTVNNVDDYTIELVFTNSITDNDDKTVLQKIIDIIFNGATPDTDVPRRVVSANTTKPLATSDYYSNFVIGSSWINTYYNRKYECINNAIGAAVWRVVPYIGLQGTGTGPTGTYQPFEGAVLQYNTTSKLWCSQPGKYQTVIVNNLLPSNTNPPSSSSGSYVFSSSGSEQLFGSLVIPNDYAEGSDIIFNVGYQTTTANSGTVSWDLVYSWADNNDVFPSVTTITSSSDTTGSSNKHIRSNFQSISGTGKHILSAITFSITRTATGNYPDNVRLLYCNVSYNTNGVGSTQTYIK